MNIRFHIGKNAIALSVQRDDDGITVTLSHNNSPHHDDDNKQ